MDRRQFSRYTLHTLAIASFNGVLIQGFTLNISTGGICVYLPADIPKLTQVSTQFIVNDQKNEFAGEIIMRHPVGGMHIYGILFESPDEDQMKEVIQSRHDISQVNFELSQ